MFTGLLPSTPGLRTPVHQGLRCNSTDRFASLEFLPVIAPVSNSDNLQPVRQLAARFGMLCMDLEQHTVDLQLLQLDVGDLQLALLLRQCGAGFIASLHGDVHHLVQGLKIAHLNGSWL